ncbi:Cytochrome b561 [Macleaya cordata]|uniref:Cytochrome b561 n=1 Tax=Macleaya cordata TaxID=56857 RepID=A0A200QE93_MACCD|nr:Cytochrome b561 [Macleaya cordata]OVA09766.1 Cytochrome b561 [Macleaya cordata]
MPSLLLSITAHQTTSCNEAFSSLMKMRKNITQCKKLGTLGAELGWNYYNGTQNRNTIEIVFGARPGATTGWVAWGINPCPRPHMVGTRALIGFQQPNGSLVLKTYNITRETKIGCPLKPSEIDVKIDNQQIMYLQDTGFLIISATISLPPHEYNITRLNHVWQVGSMVKDMEPQMHSLTLHNVDSSETIDLISGKSRSGAGYRRQHVHGILNIVGWGTLLPIGMIIARYFKEFPVKYKGWFSLHVSCQISAYIIGTIGWVTGIWLGNASKDYVFRIHRIFGITVFTFTTLQVLALWLRPNVKDEYRKYWSIYHHFLGYGLIPVIIMNIFHGIDILRPAEKWKWAYVAILGVFGSSILVLEAFTWTKHILQSHRRS